MATKVKLVADGVVTADQLTLTTASTGTNTTAPATTAFVQQEVAALVDSSPDALNTLNELAAALGDDANFSTTVTNSIATKLPLAGGTLTGTLTLADIASSGYLQLTANDVDFIVRDTTDSPSNFIWRDHSASKLYLGTPAAEVTIRSDAIIDTGYKIGIGTSNPSFPLHISSSSTDVAKFQTSGSYAYTRFQNSSKTWALSVGSSFSFYDEAASATRMVIDSSGNVAIGDTSSRSFRLYLENAGSSGAGQLMLVDSDNDTLQREIRTDAGVLSFDYWDSSNRSNHLTILANGNVGIGTSSPTYPFHLTGNGDTVAAVTAGASSVAALNLGNSTNLADGGIRYDNSADALIFRASNAEKMRIDNAGNVIIGTTNDGAPGLTIEESRNLSFGTGNDNESYVNFFRQSSSAAAVMATGYRRSSTANKMESSHSTSWAKSAVTANYGTIRFYTDSASADAVGTTLTPTERMRIDSSGNVGIGGTPDSSGRLLVTNGGTNQIVLKGASGTTNLNMGNFVGGGYISNNYYYSSGHQADDNTKGAFEIFIGDDNYGINYHSAGAMGTRRRDFAINNTGNIGIGTNSPDALLHLSGGSGEKIILENAASPRQNYIGFSSSDNLEIAADEDNLGADSSIRFRVDAAEKMRIDSSGRVGIGVSPSAKLEVQDANGVSLKFGDLASYPNNVVPCFIGTGTSALAGVNGDLVLVPRTSDAGKIIFATGNGGAATEKVRIANDGNVGIGQTSPTSKLHVDAGSYAGYAVDLVQGGSGGGNHGLRVVSGSASSYTAIFRANAATVFYVDGSGNYYFSGSNQSDVNKKENIADITDSALDLITQLQPKTYNFIGSDIDKAGFIAQEMETVIPRLVTGNTYDPDLTDEDGNNPTGKGIDYMGYTAYLTKAIQELKTKLEAAEARITELEG